MLVALADELQSGVPVVGAPTLAADFDLGNGLFLFGALLAVPTIVAVAVEPVILAWSDRADRRRVLRVALALMAAFSAAAALASSPLLVAVAIGLWGAACGVASGVAQGVLVQEDASVGMARWIRGSVVGDLLAPIVVLATGDWRTAMLAAAVVPALAATLVGPVPPLVEEGADDPPFREALAAAVRDRTLLAWLVASASCSLLDEVLLLLAAMHTDAVTLFALFLGSTAGGLGVEALVKRFPPRALLLTASVASAASLLAFILDPGVASLFVLGFAAALLYPLVQARAYARVPGRPGMLSALQSPFVVVDVLAPLAIGAMVSAWGVEAGLALLLAQPVVIGAVAALRASR